MFISYAIFGEGVTGLITSIKQSFSMGQISWL